MRKKTTSAYRKIYKNSKRNTFKKKKNKNKRNIYKKKTKRKKSKNKRTKGGYWGRCHNQWEKLSDERGIDYVKNTYPYIESIRGNACFGKLEGYSAFECTKSVYNVKWNDENGNKISLSLHMSDIFKLYESIKNYLDKTIKLTNFIWGSEGNCIKRFTEINKMFESVEGAFKDPDKRNIIMPIINSYGLSR